MAQIVALTFPELVRKMAIRLADMAAFDADPLPQVWEAHDLDKKEATDWLDANAPGWKTKLRKTGHREIDILFGPEGMGTFMFYEVSVLFPQSAQREAWRARKISRQEEEERRQAYVDERMANAPADAHVCFGCGQYMHTFEQDETMRIAQFAFTVKRETYKCGDCGMEVCEGKDTDALFDAADMVQPMVGLPGPDDSDWSDEVLTERTRRRKLPPVATVHVQPDMTAQDIVDALKAELAKQ